MQDANPVRPDEAGTTVTRGDVPGKSTSGTENPVPPFHSFILKIHSRCDLACDYCYMYRSVDQSWRTQPRVMAPAVVDRTADRIAEHAAAHRLDAVTVVLHGGEPLLAGPPALTRTVRVLRRALDPAIRLDVTVQTNAVRLDEAYLAVLAGLGVRIGVSMDGDRAAHDRHRRRADGRGSHDQVAAAVRRLADGPYRPLFGGLLCTIDLRNDPVETYRHLLSYDPPMVDFLLPHGNWSIPPPGRRPGGTDTPYAQWLIAVFEEWFGAPVRRTRVRLLEELITLLLGGRARVEGLGLAPVGYAVVETDGAIGRDATLRTAYPGAITTGLHVARDPFDRALRPAAPGEPLPGPAGLSGTCRACPLHRVCGGGHTTHRYRDDGSAFANPSVYCPDLAALIGHVGARLTGDLGQLLAHRGPAGPADGP
ncbi:FxsB family cyclophane-forming radical SAM/SPASM peptide maturase [Streptomyces uncialis]|uniref:FxsB family cyclophane-forming radical SAM/SPASM peptide maturase n=1 Tax=Streptomyces uncialis TaxID=1048205 RepID=UPI003F61B796